MTNATITKTLKKLTECNEDYSLGFKRCNVLPRRVIKALNLSLYLSSGHINTPLSDTTYFLGEMTDKEFVNYLKLV